MRDQKTKKTERALRPFSMQEISFFCMQISLILKAGIPLYEGVRMIADDCSDRRLNAAISAVSDQVMQNRPLHEAMDTTGLFPKYVVDMAAIGEISGRLENVMMSLSHYYDRERSLREGIKRAVVYPGVLFLMMSIIIAVIITKVLPVFESILRELGGEISVSATALLRAGTAIGSGAFWVMAVVLLAAAAVFCLSRFPRGKDFLGRTLFGFGPLRRLSEKITTGRFASAMAMTLASGLDIPRSLELAANLSTDNRIRAKIIACQKRAEEGVPFAEIIGDAGIFPELFTRMLRIGARTGSLETVMEKLAGIYEEDVDSSLENLIASIEPVLVTVLALIVGAILLAVMLPLTGIMSSIG